MFDVLIIISDFVRALLMRIICVGSVLVGVIL